jgi:very-short-patch-repair endonuclease
MTTDRNPILGLAAQQFGLFTTAQADELGLSIRMLQRWRSSGAIRLADRSVWAVRGAPVSADQRALAAVLRHGSTAVLSGASAAWLWRLHGRLPEPFEVSRIRGARSGAGQCTHTSRLFDSVDITVRRGIPTTTPLRTVFDLAGHQHIERTRKDLNDLMGRGLITLDMLDAGLDRLAARGRNGIAAMRKLIADAHDKGAPAGSNLELVVEDLLDQAGFREIERQVPVYDEDGFIARVDFGERRRRIAIEVDSDRFHHGLLDKALDATKSTRLVRCGWTIERIVEQEVWWDRPALVTRLRQLLWSTTPSHDALSAA